MDFNFENENELNEKREKKNEQNYIKKQFEIKTEGNEIWPFRRQNE